MKKLIASCIFWVFSITLVLAQTPNSGNGSVLIQTSKPSTQITRHTWVLIVTPQTTKHSLDSVSAAWKKDSINLKFSKLQYKKGKLMVVSGSVHFMSKDVGGKFTQDTVSVHPLEIKLDDTPGIWIRGLTGSSR